MSNVLSVSSNSPNSVKRTGVLSNLYAPCETLNVTDLSTIVLLTVTVAWRGSKLPLFFRLNDGDALP